MNRHQRRTDSRQSRPAPHPLVGNGQAYSFAGPLEGAIVDAEGARLSATALDFNAAVAHYPYRTLVGLVGAKQIGGAWVVPSSAPLPVPQFILEAVIEQGLAGRFFLLLATDRQARDQAKAAIQAVLDTAAGNA